ncbi:MAG TPA: heme ABC transporter permease [Devosia sp.]|nr:heme ABC transporter permease [Devosia sp.]
MTIELTAKRPNWFSRLANPGQFLAWSKGFVWPLVIITGLLFIAGLYYAFFDSPPDYQMGETVRIMYIHVPNAWLSQFVYGVMAVASIGTLVWRHPLADVTAKSAAPLGAVFTGLALFSGSLWGRPTWGTFWEWDGRMTSTLILFLIYLGIIALWRAFEDQGRAGRIIAIFTLVGALDIPVVKFSVDWWNTLHQPASVLTMSGEHVAPAILIPLLVMTLAFTLLFATLLVVRMRTEILKRRAETLERQAAASIAG